MFKKLLLVCTLAGMTSTTFAAPYVGASLGVVTNTSSAYQQTSTVNTPSNFRGVPLSVFVGLGGVVYQSFYLAGELTGTLATAEISDNKGLKTSYGYGASLIPGVMLSEHVLAFIRAGAVRSRFSDVNSTQSGGVIGLGFQTPVTQNIDVRGEYDYTSYGSFDNNYGRINSPRQDAFNLALLYKFE